MTVKKLTVPMSSLILFSFLFLALLGVDTINSRTDNIANNRKTMKPSKNIYENQYILSDVADWAHFGISVSVNGDYAIVGAPGDYHNSRFSGSAFIYHHEGNRWFEQSKLVPKNAGNYIDFGCSVSISDDYAIVGALWADRTGAAYIFHRQDKTWKLQEELTPADGEDWDRFGNSVSISGDFAVIGSEDDDDDGNQSGSAYIFQRIGSTWIQIAKITADDAAELDAFGKSVAISGDFIIVGAYGDDLEGGGSSGSAYIFYRDGNSWKQQAKIRPDDGGFLDDFGWSVSISGNFAIVGARYNDSTGSAYIFKREGTVWNQFVKLLADDSKSGDSFGSSVSISGNTAIIGATRAGNNEHNSGSTYIFEFKDDKWAQKAKLVASDGESGDKFGGSVSISINRAFVGSPNNKYYGSGAVYAFKVPGPGDIKTSIKPSGAFAGGAMWRLSFQQGWRKPGTIAHGVEPGTYTIRYKPIEGWIKPADEEILVESDKRTLVTGTYIKKDEQPDYGFLKVILKPNSARENNARWKIFGSDKWRKSHAKIKFPVGTARIKCNRIKGFQRPSTRTAEIQAGKLTVVEVVYEEK